MTVTESTPHGGPPEQSSASAGIGPFQPAPQPLAGHDSSATGGIPRPKIVDIAVYLLLGAWCIDLVGQIIGVVVNFQSTPALLDQIKRAQRTPMPFDTSAFLHGMLIAMVVVLLMTFSLWMLFIVKARSGRNWARIAMAVIGPLALISSIAGAALVLSKGTAVPTWPLAVAGLVGRSVAMVAVVLLFFPAASRYFSRQ